MTTNSSIRLPGIWEPRCTRRQFVQASAVSLFGLLNQRSPALAASVRASRIESCIVIMLYGGPSHLDTWDMKPNAPVEIRGDYRPIATSVPGRYVCEHLPQCARIVNHLTVIRSMRHTMSNHNSAMYQALVGRRPKIDLDVLGAQRSEDFPCMGSTVDFAVARGQLAKAAIPLNHVALPHVMHNVVDLPGQNAGFLGGRHDPLQINTDPNLATFEVPNLDTSARISSQRSATRLSLLQTLQNRSSKESNDVDGLVAYQHRAFELLNSAAVKRAFRMDTEVDAVRDRYGRNTLGQSILLARKLVESGVRFINVNDKIYNGQDANWDSHEKLFPRHRELLPPFDQAFSALIEDLDQRGLLETTLVVAMGEFGRTPRVNSNGGRDHWPDCYSIVLAGGGSAAGSTWGESDHFGAYPVSHPMTPGDLAATIFWRFGLDPTQIYRDPLGRPFPYAEGHVVREIFS